MSHLKLHQMIRCKMFYKNNVKYKNYLKLFGTFDLLFLEKNFKYLFEKNSSVGNVK